jgi:hypothetical protein
MLPRRAKAAGAGRSEPEVKEVKEAVNKAVNKATCRAPRARCAAIRPSYVITPIDTAAIAA